MSNATVPELDWPCRCRRCRQDLTGEAVEDGRVLCQACGASTRYPPATDRPVTRQMAIWIIAVLAILTTLTTIFVVFIALRPPPT